jgi:hypothetical protein
MRLPFGLRNADLEMTLSVLLNAAYVELPITSSDGILVQSVELHQGLYVSALELAARCRFAHARIEERGTAMNPNVARRPKHYWHTSMRCKPASALMCIFLSLVFVSSANAQAEEEPSCLSPKLTASTDRPTYSSGTETTQCGVLEILGGTDRVWVGRGLHQDDVAQGLQLGITKSMDFHYAGNLFFRDGNHAGPLSGVSDSYAGVRYRFSRQTKSVPSFGGFYTTKVPTASTAFGLSSGRYDHFLTLIVSKDLPKVHLDFNLTQQMVGRPIGSGYDRNEAFVLFGSAPVMKNLTLVVGGYGFNALNASTPAYGVATVGFDWQVAHRLILDLSMDEGLTSGAPRKRIGFGFTYAPANLYAFFVHPKENVH